MMDHDRAEKPLLRRALEDLAEPSRLPLHEETIGHEGRRGARRRDPDQRDVAAHAQIWEGIAVDRRVDTVAAHPRRPRPADLVEGAGHIGIMVSRHDRNVMRWPQRLEP